ncbi:MAG: DUF2062 domain-containing protein [Planctomycetota bacterium]
MSYLTETFRSYFKTAKDFCVYRVLHADDPPHTLALGIAVGMFVTFLPLIGFQMMISFFLAWLLRANKVVGVPIVWISNPLTLVPIYYPCYVVGCKILGMEVVSDKWDVINAEWDLLLTEASTRWIDKVRFWWDILVDSLAPLSVGCLLVASLAAVVSYYISLFAIRKYRLRRWGQLMPPRTTPTESIEDNAIAKKETTAEETAA